jgi:hypothetical protein
MIAESKKRAATTIRRQRGTPSSVSAVQAAQARLPFIRGREERRVGYVENPARHPGGKPMIGDTRTGKELLFEPLTDRVSMSRFPTPLRFSRNLPWISAIIRRIVDPRRALEGEDAW